MEGVMPEERWTDEQMYYLYLSFWNDYWEADVAKLKKAKEVLKEVSDEDYVDSPIKPRVKMSLEVFIKSLADFPDQRSEFLRVWRLSYHNSGWEMASKMASCAMSLELSQEEKVKQIMAIASQYHRYVNLS